MDPYLEAHWLDVHTSLVTASRNALNERLPEDLIARAEERIAIETPEESRRISPDVRVFDTTRAATTGVWAPEHGQATTAVAPVKLVALIDPLVERFIEIIEPSGDRLVTVIEFISPTNKVGDGIDAFKKKREELLSGHVNVVEIDLTRTGDWQKLLLPQTCPPRWLTTYRAIVRLPAESISAYMYRISLQAPLPALPIPLRPTEPPVELDLQPLIEQAYHNGRYARTIDYDRPPYPPLDEEDDRWADALLRGAGKRQDQEGR